MQSVMSSSKRKRVRKWVFCDHCQKEVSHATFYRHKRLNLSKEYDQDLSSDFDSDKLSEDDNLSDLCISRCISSNEDDVLFAGSGDHNGNCENDLYNDSALHGSEEVYKADVQVHFDN